MNWIDAHIYFNDDFDFEGDVHRGKDWVSVQVAFEGDWLHILRSERDRPLTVPSRVVRFVEWYGRQDGSPV